MSHAAVGTVLTLMLGLGVVIAALTAVIAALSSCSNWKSKGESASGAGGQFIQTPRSREILSEILWTPPAQTPFAELRWFRFSVARLDGNGLSEPEVTPPTPDPLEQRGDRVRRAELDAEVDKVASALRSKGLKNGDRVRLTSVRPEQHFTQPPPRFTEASLVKELERLGTSPRFLAVGAIVAGVLVLDVHVRRRRTGLQRDRVVDLSDLIHRIAEERFDFVDLTLEPPAAWFPDGKDDPQIAPLRLREDRFSVR